MDGGACKTTLSRELYQESGADLISFPTFGADGCAECRKNGVG